MALKILAPTSTPDERFAERFQREAQALAKLSHPGIVTVHDFGQANGFFYLLMEFVDGVNLRQALKAERFSPEQALAVVPPICEALQYAHERGIVHRDIKPENLLLDKDGRVKIADFGIARILGANEPTLAGAAPGGDLTEASTLGTPKYMAPEQREAPRTVDSRADIYSLGVVLYELLTGELPTANLEPPSRKVQVDVRLDEIVLRALEKTPELRFQTAADFRTQVETLAIGASSNARRSDSPPAGATSWTRSPWLVVAAVLLVLLGVVAPIILSISAARAEAMRQRALAQQQLVIALENEKQRARAAELENELAVMRKSQTTPDAKESPRLQDEIDRVETELRSIQANTASATRSEPIPGASGVGISLGGIVLIMLPLIILLGGTMLGWRQLRFLRAHPKPRPGVGFALVAALFLPLILVDLVVGFVFLFPFNHGEWVNLGLVLAGLAVIAADIWIIRRVLRWLNDPNGQTNPPGGVSMRLLIGILLVVLAIIFLGVFASRREAVMSGPKVAIAISDARIEDGSAIFKYAAEPDKGWDVWLVATQWEPSKPGEKADRERGRQTRVLSGKGTFKVQLGTLGALGDHARGRLEAAMLGLQKDKLVITPSRSVGLFEVTTTEGERISAALELRPKAEIESSPAHQIYLRELSVEPTQGQAAMSFDVISYAEGYDLAVETTGADVEQVRADGTPLGPPEGGRLRTIDAESKQTFLVIPAGSSANLRWKFSPIASGGNPRVRSPRTKQSCSVTTAAPLPLFDQMDRSTGARVTATVRLSPHAIEPTAASESGR